MQVELDKDQILSEIVAKLKAHFKPTKVYLFGSRATGKDTPDSDYDLFLIVKDSDKSSTERMKEAYKLLWGRTVSIDVFVYTEAEYNEFKDEFSSIAHTVATEGVEI